MTFSNHLFIIEWSHFTVAKDFKFHIEGKGSTLGLLKTIRKW